MTYSYSTDSEFFDGEYETPEAAAVAAFIEDECLESVEVGETVKHPAKHYVSAQSIIDEMKCSAADTSGDAAEDWLDLATNEQLAELEELVAAWAEKVEPVHFWSIQNTKTITRAELIAKGLLQEDAA